MIWGCHYFWKHPFAVCFRDVVQNDVKIQANHLGWQIVDSKWVKNPMNSDFKGKFLLRMIDYLIGGFNPFEKYPSKSKSSSNRDEHKKIKIFETIS